MIKPILQDEEFISDVQVAATKASHHLHLWWLGQSGFLVQHGPWLILIDPYLSDSLTTKYAATDKPHVRISQRVVAPDALEDISFVLATHAHTDHLDPETLRAIRRNNEGAVLIAPRAIRGIVSERWGGEDNLILMSDGESQLFGDIAFRAIPAAHSTINRDTDGNAFYLGYVIRAGQLTVYHSGDTLLYEGMSQLLVPHSIDIAILPINGKVGNMGGRDAARLAKGIGARVVIPCHYDMFEFNTADPKDEFIPECERLRQPYRVLKLGERFSSDELPPR
jgi:L-ascorbate metabolism protein UlaG (beta-lactamase superfamily)